MYERFECMKGLGLCSVNERGGGGGGGGVPLKDNEESHCIVSVRGSRICGVAYTVERLLHAWDGLCHCEMQCPLTLLNRGCGQG